MPRELVHWMVLDSARGRLAHLAPAVGRCLTSAPHAAYLGAVAHDAPYYLRFGASGFERVAEILHGTQGEDTLDPIRSLLKVISVRQTPETLLAFTIGMVSHIAVDAVFHPLVYYSTGDYYDRDAERQRLARTQHRLFEVYLDSWFRSQKTAALPHRIAPLVRALGRDFAVVCSLLEQALCLKSLCAVDDQTSNWRTAFRYLSTLQSLFLNTPAGALMRVLPLGTLKQFDALFFFRRDNAQALFCAPIEYLHPVTGESLTHHVDELFEAAVEKFRALALLFEPACAGKIEDTLVALEPLVGPSLNSGLPHSRSDEMKFFGSGEKGSWEKGSGVFLKNS